jgi:hypothetical protein
MGRDRVAVTPDRVAGEEESVDGINLWRPEVWEQARQSLNGRAPNILFGVSQNDVSNTLRRLRREVTGSTHRTPPR